MIQYFELPEGAVASVGKSGSTALAVALLETHWPGHRRKTVGADAGNSPGWQSMVPKADDPEAPIVPVREPVERFRSAVAQIRRAGDVDGVLDALENGGRLARNVHFRETGGYVREGSPLYRFPEHVAELAEAVGVPEIRRINDSASNLPAKPELTDEQLARVEAYFADDIALYDSIAEPGQPAAAGQAKEPIPEPEPVRPVPRTIENWRGKVVLKRRGILSDVEAAFAGLPAEEREVVEAAWAQSALSRHGPTVLKIAGAIGLADEELDDIFREAAAIVV